MQIKIATAKAEIETVLEIRRIAFIDAQNVPEEREREEYDTKTREKNPYQPAQNPNRKGGFEEAGIF